jgi:hypothetical protein
VTQPRVSPADSCLQAENARFRFRKDTFLEQRLSTARLCTVGANSRPIGVMILTVDLSDLASLQRVET